MAAKAANKKISKSLWFFSMTLPLGYVAFLMHIASLAPQYRPPNPNQDLPKTQQFTFYKDLPTKDLGEIPVLTISKNRELKDPTKPSAMANPKSNSQSTERIVSTERNRRPAKNAELSNEWEQDSDFSRQVKQNFANRVLQVGSYRSWKEADRKRAELALLGLAANIETTKINNQKAYRVNLGPFKQERDFKNAQQTLSLYDIPSMTKSNGAN